jgi:hypothetical protein
MQRFDECGAARRFDQPCGRLDELALRIFPRGKSGADAWHQVRYEQEPLSTAPTAT